METSLSMCLHKSSRVRRFPDENPYFFKFHRCEISAPKSCFLQESVQNFNLQISLTFLSIVHENLRQSVLIEIEKSCLRRNLNCFCQFTDIENQFKLKHSVHKFCRVAHLKIIVPGGLCPLAATWPNYQGALHALFSPFRPKNDQKKLKDSIRDSHLSNLPLTGSDWTNKNRIKKIGIHFELHAKTGTNEKQRSIPSIHLYLPL